MALETLEIGGTPHEERCASIGESSPYDGTAMSQLEARCYIFALKKHYGQPPEGSRYLTKANRHDFGTYYEAAYRFDPDNPEHAAYAEKVENGLARWLDARVWAPCVYDDKGIPRAILENAPDWDMDANPSRTSNPLVAAALRPDEPPNPA